MSFREKTIKEKVHEPKLTRSNQLLLVLACEPSSPIKVKDIVTKGKQLGLRGIEKWNVSEILSRAKGSARLVSNGWELTEKALTTIEQDYNLKNTNTPATTQVVSLKNALSKIKNEDGKSFVEEAISCLEGGYKRAAVVLSWAGAVAVLYDYVVNNHLAAFNVEASRRNNGKWKNAANSAALANMKEFEFLEVIETIGVIDNSVKQELQTVCLKLRNSCGHPNSLKIGDNRVATHLEVLMLNIFSRFL